MIGLAEFRSLASQFLARHLEPRSAEGAFVWGRGSDDVSILGDRSEADELEELRRAREWQACKFDHGYGWLSGDERFGGGGLTQAHESLFDELEGGYQIPDQIFFGIGHGMVGPTILAAGSAELQERYLRGIYRGDLICCQLFSEPGAGSDLSAISTLAIPDGSSDSPEWVVTGQKVWTSGAQYSDLGLLLARTNRDVPRHRGLTMFLLDMHAPGVEVRPLRQLTGGCHFNEVFFDGARIPDSHRLGPVDGGWGVAVATLAKERTNLGPGGSMADLGEISIEHLVALLDHHGRRQDPLVRQRLGRLYGMRRIADNTARRLLARTPPGEPPGAEMSMCKILNTDILEATADLVESVLGESLTADTGEWGSFAWATYVLGVPGMKLGGGTDEIQKNILAERVLGLPREPRTAGR